MSQLSQNTEKPSLNPEQWVDKYGDYLYNFALGRLRNSTNAENAVQETLLAAFQSINSFSGKSTERTWLIGILKHKIIDHFRKNYREKPVTDITGDEQAIDQFFDRTTHLKNSPKSWEFNPSQLLENKEFWGTFQNCLTKLSSNARDAFVLREVEKLDGKEVCKTLNISSSNFWVLLHRARLQLRECLEENWFK